MMDRISEYLKNTTSLEDQFTVSRILIMDGAGNGVKTVRELSDSGYYFITMLDSNQFNERKVKSVSEEKGNEKPFKSLKKKKVELARIVDKKKIYRVDVELDQIMTCFKISFANICCYLLDECFKGEKMTLQRLFDTIFDLRGKTRVEGDQRNIFIERNTKQEYIMCKLESALGIINRMGIEDTNGCRYKFKLV